MTSDGQVKNSREVYCDFPDDTRKEKMSDFLPPFAPFLHPDHLLSEDWWKWLCKTAGVNTSPHLLEHGHLCPEFLEQAPQVKTKTLDDFERRMATLAGNHQSDS
jgi:hypothetical protein